MSQAKALWTKNVSPSPTRAKTLAPKPDPHNKKVAQASPKMIAAIVTKHK